MDAYELQSPSFEILIVEDSPTQAERLRGAATTAANNGQVQFNSHKHQNKLM